MVSFIQFLLLFMKIRRPLIIQSLFFNRCCFLEHFLEDHGFQLLILLLNKIAQIYYCNHFPLQCKVMAKID